MTHSEISARMAERHTLGMTAEARAGYYVALVKALDDTQFNRCMCNAPSLDLRAREFPR